jgi:xanthine dehydrogenase small subunit
MQGAQGFSFLLNGERIEVLDAAPDTTLLDWLRRSGRVGTKCGCNEGDCGACTVALLDTNAAGQPTWRAINSCIALLPMFAGRELVTVEGVADGATLHPVQSCMVKHYGSQCGYCTPGFVMSLFEGYYRDDLREHWQVADQLCGNLCRCTGYRPIRDAALHAFAQRTGEDRFSARLQQPSVSVAALRLENGAEAFLRPNSFPELFALKRQYPTAPYVAGATEIGVLINKRYLRFPQLISLDGIEELRRIETTPEAWHIGGAATLTAIEEVLRDELPAFGKMLRLFASRQIRSRATLGGNLATASPIGDSAPVLLALDASVVLVSENGERAIPLSKFFVGYRKTVLLPDELIKTVIIPQRRGVGVPRAARRVAPARAGPGPG